MHLLYFTKLSRKSQDFYFIVGIHLNNHEAGDLRRQNAHYDVTVMHTLYLFPANGVGWRYTNSFAHSSDFHAFADTQQVSLSSTFSHSPLNACCFVSSDWWSTDFPWNRQAALWRIVTFRLFVIPWYIMMTSSNGNIFRVTGHLCGEFTGPGEFPTQRPVTRSFDAFFDLRLNKRLSKLPWGWWFETPSWSLWRQCNVILWTGRKEIQT